VNPVPTATSTPGSQTICSGNSTGLSLSSSVGGSTFSWTVSQSGVTGASTGGGSAIVQSLSATGAVAGTANYFITAVSPAGCSSSSITAVVTVNPNPAVTSPGSYAICSGGTLSANFTSSIPSSTYTWSATDNPSTTGESLSLQTGSTLNNTIVSSAPVSTNVSYTVQATSPAGCAGSFYPVTVTVNSIPVINSSPSSTTICSGSTVNFSLGSSIAGTTYSYVYSPSGVTGGSNGTTSVISQTLSTTAASTGTANYTVTGTVSGCSSNPLSVVATVNPIPTVSPSNPSICAGSSATVTSSVSPAGGSYSWSPASGTSSSISVTPATTMTYTLSYTYMGCTGNGTGTVTVHSIPTVSNSVADVTCAGACNGSITATPSGGGIPYNYVWSPGGITTQVASGLCAGSYTVTVTDAFGCIAAQSSTVAAPSPLNLTLTNANATCFGLCNGSITGTATGGVLPYTYNWTGSVPGPYAGQGTSGLTNLCPGTYTLTITDLNGCTTTQSAVITEPTQINPAVTSGNTTCFGSCDGIANSFTSGGTPSYTYNWSPGSPSGDGTAFVTGLCAGTYTLDITDANGCTFSDIINIGSPSPVTAVASPSQTICAGDSVHFTGTGSGGTAPYTYNWNDGSTNYASQNLNYVPAASSSYTFTVTDDNACTANDFTNALVMSHKDISGHVTYSGGTLSSGSNTAVLYGYVAATGTFDTAVVTAIDASGFYYFSSVAPNNYLVKIFQDTAAYPLLIPTYYGGAYVWDSAAVILHDCSLSDTADILMIEVPAISGPGHVSGTISEGTGFSRVPGDPVPGVDIKLGRNPGGQLVASTQTGTGPTAGQYSFDNIPANLPGENYVIYVDLPGLDRISTYSFVIDAGHTSFTGMDYEADSTTVYTTQTSVGIVTGNKPENQLSIYPNPAKDIMTVQYTLEKDAAVSLCIYNVLGIKVAEIISARESAGNHKSVVNKSNYNMPSGVYFITLVKDGKTSSQRLVIAE
jgi:hypothetical protein